MTAPNQAWVTDITCIATDEGWLYSILPASRICSMAHWCYALDSRMTQNLVMQALFRAVPPSGPGKVYGAHTYQKLLQQFGMQASISRKGNSAGTMHQWKAAGAEQAHHRRFATCEQARSEIAEYIEIFSNRIRKQVRLGHLPPTAFCQQYYVR